MRFQKFMLCSIVLIYCLLSFLYAVLTPPWESPDEPAHYLYVSELAANWRPPPKSNVQQMTSFSRDQAYTTSNYEWYQPALGYLPGALIYKVLTILAPQSLPREMPLLSSLRPTIQSRYDIFIHPVGGILQVWGNAWGLLIIRIILSLLGLPVIFVLHNLGILLDKNGFLGIMAAGWIAFLPQFTFSNATIRSDTLTNAIAALVFLSIALMQNSFESRNKYALGTGVLLGLGILSKYTFIYIIPTALFAVVLTNPRNPRAWITPIIHVLVPILVMVGAYYVVYDEARIAFAYTLNTTLQLKPEALTWHYLVKIPLPLLIDLFYARFGWANVATPNLWSRLAFSIWAIGGGLTLMQTWRLLKKPEARQTIKIIVILAAGFLLAFLGAVRYNLSNFSPQGRYLFPALVPYAIIGFWGPWQSLSTRSRRIVSIAAIGFMLAFNLYSLLFSLLPAYH